VIATKKEIRYRATGTKEVLVGLLRKVFETVDFTAAIAAYLNKKNAPDPKGRQVIFRTVTEEYLMRTQKLKELIYGEMNCVVCDIAFSKLYEAGFGEFAQAIRHYAESLWTLDEISKEERHSIHEQISGLLQNVSGEVTEQEFSTPAAIAFLDHVASVQPKLQDDWNDVKCILRDKGKAD
jgi:hypothetical protein